MPGEWWETCGVCGELLAVCPNEDDPNHQRILAELWEEIGAGDA
jgi:hypothetical protein